MQRPTPAGTGKVVGKTNPVLDIIELRPPPVYGGSHYSPSHPNTYPGSPLQVEGHPSPRPAHSLSVTAQQRVMTLVYGGEKHLRDSGVLGLGVCGTLCCSLQIRALPGVTDSSPPDSCLFHLSPRLFTARTSWTLNSSLQLKVWIWSPQTKTSTRSSPRVAYLSLGRMR